MFLNLGKQQKQVLVCVLWLVYWPAPGLQGGHGGWAHMLHRLMSQCRPAEEFLLWRPLALLICAFPPWGLLKQLLMEFPTTDWVWSVSSFSLFSKNLCRMKPKQQEKIWSIFWVQQNFFSHFGSRSHSLPTLSKLYPNCSSGQDPVLDFQNRTGWGKGTEIQWRRPSHGLWPHGDPRTCFSHIHFVTGKKGPWIHVLASLANVNHGGWKSQSVSRRVVCWWPSQALWILS